MKHVVVGTALSISGTYYPEGSIVDSSVVDIQGVEQYLQPIHADVAPSAPTTTPGETDSTDDPVDPNAGGSTDSDTKTKKGGKQQP